MKCVNELTLNGTWEIKETPLDKGEQDAKSIASSSKGWISCPVPGDIHQGLINAGRIEEPLIGLNSRECQWTEDHAWWFRTTFETKKEWNDADRVEIELHGLDAEAQIFLNNEKVGAHHNTFYPFIEDIKPFISSGKNTLLVRLTTGVDSVKKKDLKAFEGVLPSTEGERGYDERGDHRRSFVRKPQYTFGWDWSPRLATTAIAGDVTIRAIKQACIRDVQITPVKHGDDAVLKIETIVENLSFYKTCNGIVEILVTDEDGNELTASRTTLLRSGYTYVNESFFIKNPRLWWPAGMGEQHRYQVKVKLQVDGKTAVYPAFSYGIRFVELKTDGEFTIVINDRPVFCKGANWIPADALYARVTDETYETLVSEAAACNFNMLRIWGGGWYERDAYYDACDRHGIMVWHDFMFACAPYPDHQDDFCAEIEKEAAYQTKRLRRFPSVVLWCGSNENIWALKDWWGERTQGGARAYNYILPAAVRQNCPEIPYWNSSPYGGDEPNAFDVGDCHHWEPCMMNVDMEKRITPEEYDKCLSLFVSEYGYIGGCSPETVKTYLGTDDIDRTTENWHHHTNTFEKDTVDAGIRKHYCDTDELDPEKYLLYSGMCQGLMYQYAIDSMRFRANCSGSLFWMYEDCWGEMGWTIIDYNRDRKPSWYFVRRAYAPLRLICRQVDDQVRVVCVNDTSEQQTLSLEYGYAGLDGIHTDVEHADKEIAPYTHEELLCFPRKDHDPHEGLWFARTPGNNDVDPAILRVCDFRELHTTDPGLSIRFEDVEEKQCIAIVSSRAYAHAVWLTVPAGYVAADQYFDILPGGSRKIVITADVGLDTKAITITCVNAVHS